MPTQKVCETVADALARVMRSAPRTQLQKDGIVVRRSLEEQCLLFWFPEMRRQFPAIHPVVLHSIVLLAFLNHTDYRGVEAPPRMMLNDFMRLAIRQLRTQPRKNWEKCLVECALAYGAGWQRRVVVSEHRWNGYWPLALFELTQIAIRFAVKLFRNFSGGVRDFTAEELHGSWQDILGEAAEYAVAVFIGRRPTPKDPKYHWYQSLAKWLPKKGNLYGWLQRALRGGGPQNGLPRPKWAALGVIYEFLKQEKWLDVGPVAFQVCRVCHHDWEFNGKLCPRCGHTSKIIARHLLIVPLVYLGRKFWHCKEHDLYYTLKWPFCPECGSDNPRRPTTLLVRSQFTSIFGSQPPDDEDDE